MFVEFKQAVNFFGKTYKIGICEIPPEVEKHPYFLLMAKSNMVLEVEMPTKPKTLEEISKESAEKSEALARKLTAEEVQKEKPKKKKG